ncbi:MAG: hypothetical protein A3I00_05465 [Betaproteobacteria bacterium RIFCSPLOWO2_02_FULL_64_12]|nr:MAG: hypothetical protein A3I00_05465 [Betaproteobacteria bacterium RIFCSPLOWO2_02_FULL_64_12]
MGFERSLDSGARPLRVCIWGTYEIDHPRTRNILRGLALNGVDIHHCHRAVWGSSIREDKTKGWLGRLVLGVIRLVAAYAVLIPAYVRSPEHDVLLVAYFGHIDVFVARWLAWLRGRPLVFDAFFSLFDTVVQDRQLVSRRSLIGRLARLMDRWACRMADLVLLDTLAHVRYFEDEIGVPSGKALRVWVGAEEEFRPLPAATRHEFVVLHFGKYIPLHGMGVIVGAASLLADDPLIRFVLVGRGQDFPRTRALVERLELRNVTFIDWLEPKDLRAAIADAHVSLGVFGSTPKAARVIPNKVYIALAMGQAVITGDSPAARELLRDREHALLIPRGDSAALAEAIRELRADEPLRLRIALNGGRLFHDRCTAEIIGRELSARLVDLAISARGRDRECGSKVK